MNSNKTTNNFCMHEYILQRNSFIILISHQDRQSYCYLEVKEIEFSNNWSDLFELLVELKQRINGTRGYLISKLQYFEVNKQLDMMGLKLAGYSIDRYPSSWRIKLDSDRLDNDIVRVPFDEISQRQDLRVLGLAYELPDHLIYDSQFNLRAYVEYIKGMEKLHSEGSIGLDRSKFTKQPLAPKLERLSFAVKKAFDSLYTSNRNLVDTKILHSIRIKALFRSDSNFKLFDFDCNLKESQSICEDLAVKLEWEKIFGRLEDQHSGLLILYCEIDDIGTLYGRKSIKLASLASGYFLQVFYNESRLADLDISMLPSFDEDRVTKLIDPNNRKLTYVQTLIVIR